MKINERIHGRALDEKINYIACEYLEKVGKKAFEDPLNSNEGAEHHDNAAFRGWDPELLVGVYIPNIGTQKSITVQFTVEFTFYITVRGIRLAKVESDGITYQSPCWMMVKNLDPAA